MQMSVPDVVDFSRESAETKALYGVDVPHCREMGRQLLAARAQQRFVGATQRMFTGAIALLAHLVQAAFEKGDFLAQIIRRSIVGRQMPQTDGAGAQHKTRMHHLLLLIGRISTADRRHGWRIHEGRPLGRSVPEDRCRRSRYGYGRCVFSNV